MEPQNTNEAVPTTNDEGVSADAGADSAAETEAATVAENATAETTEEGKEPETTLDEELSQDAEVTVAGIPEGTVPPTEAPEGEFLAVVNSTGFVKGVFGREDAITIATQGGFSVRLATEEEVKTV